MTINEEQDTLSASQDTEDEMAQVQCQGCVRHNEIRDSDDRYREQNIYHDPRIIIQCFRGDNSTIHSQLTLEGVITCIYDGNKRPIKLVNSSIDETSPSMPVNESKKLTDNVPDWIKQDIEEAERCHFAQCYKAGVVMCRRAFQLALEDKKVTGGRTLGLLLQSARKMTPPLLTARTDALAEGIKDYGDGGAHRVENFEPQTVAMVVSVTVMALNEIYKPPASKS